MRLPPPKSDPTSIAVAVDAWWREATQNARYQVWTGECEQGMQFYAGNQWTMNGAGGDTQYNNSGWDYNGAGNISSGSEIRCIMNRLQNSIISLVASQAGDVPKYVFTPRESGDRPLSYLDVRNPMAAMLAQDIMRESPGWTPDKPIPDNLVDAIKANIDLGRRAQALAAAMGQPEPQVMDPKVLVDVTDETAAQALNVVYGAMQDQSNFQQIFIENVLLKNIIGTQPTLCEFDDDTKTFCYQNVHARQVIYDPIQTMLSRSQYAGYDEPISADEAISRYPNIAKQINEAAIAGTIQFPGSRSYTPANVYIGHTYYRDMLVIRHFWARNQYYPAVAMTPEQALASGKVTQQYRPVPSPVTDTGQVVGQGMGVTPPEELETGTGESDTDATLGGEAVGAGDTSAPPVMDQATAESYYRHEATGAEIDPSHPDWPQAKPARYGIRYLKIILSTVVTDMEWELNTIPLPFNQNIPFPYSPWSQGEPVRLIGLQTALNYVLSGIVTQQRYNAFPPEMILESVYERIGQALQNCRSRPGQRTVVPDSLMQTLGDLKKVLVTVDVPAIPEAYFKLLDMLVSLIDKEGNNAEVQQGDASASWSGEAIKSLQNAANTLTHGKSLYTEIWLKDICRWGVECIITRMSVEDVAKYLNQYPLPVIRALHDRFKRLDVDIKVEIQSSSGASKQAQTNQLIAAKQAGLSIAETTILERMDVDPDAELQKQTAWDRKKAMVAPPMAPVVAQPQAGGEVKEAKPGPRIAQSA